MGVLSGEPRPSAAWLPLMADTEVRCAMASTRSSRLFSVDEIGGQVIDSLLDDQTGETLRRQPLAAGTPLGVRNRHDDANREAPPSDAGSNSPACRALAASPQLCRPPRTDLQRHQLTRHEHHGGIARRLGRDLGTPALGVSRDRRNPSKRDHADQPASTHNPLVVSSIWASNVSM